MMSSFNYLTNLLFLYLTKSRFPGGVYAARIGVGIALVDKINCDVISNLPYFLRLQITLEIWHGRAGDAVHNLIVNNAAGYFTAL